MELDDQVCYCFHISKRKVVNYIRVRQPRVASQISDCGGAGTGCGWCVPYLKQWFEQARAGTLAASDAISVDDYAQGRSAHILSGKGKAPPGATPIIQPIPPGLTSPDIPAG